LEGLTVGVEGAEVLRHVRQSKVAVKLTHATRHMQHVLLPVYAHV
jgi:hypothetical protein